MISLFDSLVGWVIYKYLRVFNKTYNFNYIILKRAWVLAIKNATKTTTVNLFTNYVAVFENVRELIGFVFELKADLFF